MAIDPEFLRDVQRRGWLIMGADEARVLGACPRDGCSVKVSLSPERTVPETCKANPSLTDAVVESYDAARLFLRERRECLALTIREVEEIAGLTADHLAKVEIDDAARVPGIETFLVWAQALGIEVVLRPAKLPPYALRVLADTRDKLQMRRDKFRIWRARRQAR